MTTRELPVRTRAFTEESILRDSSPKYEWRKFSPNQLGLSFVRWFIRGFSTDAKLSDAEIHENFDSLARLLRLLRRYESKFGIPTAGGQNEQFYVLQELCVQLYASGAPIWVLQPVMERAAEGLTGAKTVTFFLLPRTAFVSSGSATTMFRVERGYACQLMTVMERILVRLASFGTNTKTVTSLPGQFDSAEFQTQPEWILNNNNDTDNDNFMPDETEEELRKEILDLASEGAGLFFYTHSKQYPSSKHDNDQGVDPFWKVEDSIREIFARLAALEAERAIEEAKELVALNQQKYFPTPLIVLARMMSAFGATGMWFNGSWFDMICAALLSSIVTLAQGSKVWRHERVVFEVIISVVVGTIAGLLALQWPDNLCFGAMAVGSVVDILQGLKIVSSVMEIMSKHTMAGGADFVEAFLFTGLIASFLKVGIFLSTAILPGKAETIETELGGYSTCTKPIDQLWFILILPMTNLAWAYLFLPASIKDTRIMACHGMLSFSIYFLMYRGTQDALMSTFVAALVTTMSAGIVSRFTGRQALGDTTLGLYSLVPGAYLAQGLFEATGSRGISSDLLYSILVSSVVIGLGAWSGSILCNPTILGTNRGLLTYTRSLRNRKEMYRRSSSGDANKHGAARPSAMLFF